MFEILVLRLQKIDRKNHIPKSIRYIKTMLDSSDKISQRRQLESLQGAHSNVSSKLNKPYLEFFVLIITVNSR